jgi:hypothetical protein
MPVVRDMQAAVDMLAVRGTLDQLATPVVQQADTPAAAEIRDMWAVRDTPAVRAIPAAWGTLDQLVMLVARVQTASCQVRKDTLVVLAMLAVADTTAVVGITVVLATPAA